jgi:flagellar biosynthesis/type III secretory pathway M-ring protein FliF/YscJ
MLELLKSDEFSIVVQLVIVYLGLAVVLFSVLDLLRRRRRQRAQDENDTLESKLRRLANTAGEASVLSKEITVEIDALSAAAETAKEAADRAQTIASLSHEQQAAVAALVRGEVSDEMTGRGRADFWRSVGLSVLFFVLGVVASIIVTASVAPAVPS